MRLAIAEAVVTDDKIYGRKNISEDLCTRDAQGFLWYTTSIRALINAGMKYSVYPTLWKHNVEC